MYFVRCQVRHTTIVKEDVNPKIPVSLHALFCKFKLNRIRLGPKWASAHIGFEEADKDAAWELYVELLTRIVTQPLPADAGDESVALDSIYSIFPSTRDILRRRGRQTIQFSKVAIPVLNQVVRPFTAKWHRKYLSGGFKKKAVRIEFRNELASLQDTLRNYNRILADIAGVEDLTDLEDT